MNTSHITHDRPWRRAWFWQHACLMATLTLAANSVATGQTQDPVVRNTHFTTDHGRVVIQYDLGGESRQTYRISLTLRKGSDPAYRYTPTELKGDVGVVHTAGAGRRIFWSIGREFPRGLPGSDYFFVVQAEPVEDNSGPGLVTVIGTGAAVLAAVGVYFAVAARPAQHPVAVGLPPPPGRPQ